MTPHGPDIVALIGGVGSGKSAVADEFAARGAAVIDGDALGHEVLRQPEVREQIVARFGSTILNDKGEIDRRRLAAVVFSDPARLKQLEEIMHPLIGRRIQEEIEKARGADVPLIVIDAAVLLEAGWNPGVNHLVYIDAPEEVRWQRVQARGWTREQWLQREAAQLPLTQKRSKADHVLNNSSTREHLRRQVDDLMRRWAPTAVGLP
jgi:dephospho-CoA kinase